MKNQERLPQTVEPSTTPKPGTEHWSVSHVAIWGENGTLDVQPRPGFAGIAGYTRLVIDTAAIRHLRGQVMTVTGQDWSSLETIHGSFLATVPTPKLRLAGQSLTLGEGSYAPELLYVKGDLTINDCPPPPRLVAVEGNVTRYGEEEFPPQLKALGGFVSGWIRSTLNVRSRVDHAELHAIYRVALEQRLILRDLEAELNGSLDEESESDVEGPRLSM